MIFNDVYYAIQNTSEGINNTPDAAMTCYIYPQLAICVFFFLVPASTDNIINNKEQISASITLQRLMNNEKNKTNPRKNKYAEIHKAWNNIQ